MNRCVVIHPSDTVATATADLAVGSTVEVAGRRVILVQDIPFGHKFAVTAMAIGSAVVKYGEPIGIATVAIAVGAHVHIHNLVSGRGRGDVRGRP